MNDIAQKPNYKDYLANTPKFWLCSNKIDSTAEQMEDYFQYGRLNKEPYELDSTYTFLRDLLNRVPKRSLKKPLIQALVAETCSIYTDAESLADSNEEPDERFDTVMDLGVVLYHKALCDFLPSELLVGPIKLVA